MASRARIFLRRSRDLLGQRPRILQLVFGRRGQHRGVAIWRTAGRTPSRSRISHTVRESWSHTTTNCLLSARSIPTIALLTGTSARSRASLSLRLRSPRDMPPPLPTNVLLLRWDTKPAHQEDVPTSVTDTQKVFLCRDKSARYVGRLPGIGFRRQCPKTWP
jgi:hypothetical protein